ncbi:hypothetical protein RGQ29_002411 [Quercus rubra]|uniref:Uncharacterized protein n=1 Tax=Quercus rubra TaxID=3512 RepID=A0AAN7EA39_QUERU|nr:hypothetical protein RGQ29_002411 [Quercus rubra]
MTLKSGLLYSVHYKEVQLEIQIKLNEKVNNFFLLRSNYNVGSAGTITWNAPASVNWVYLVSLRQCIKIPDNLSAVQILCYGFIT